MKHIISALKEAWNSYKTNLIDSASPKIIPISVEAWFKIFQGLLKALE